PNNEDAAPGDAAADAPASTDASADAATDGAPEGGPISNPLMVECGASSCPTGAPSYQFCCLSGDAGTCSTDTAACAPPSREACDEAADCFTGWTCCGMTPSPGTHQFGATCLFGDAGVCAFDGSIRLCKP